MINVDGVDVDGVVLVNRNVANDPEAVRDWVRSHDGLVRGVAIEACGGAADFATKLIEQTEWVVRMAHPSAVDRLKKGPDKTDHTDAWHVIYIRRGEPAASRVSPRSLAGRRDHATAASAGAISGGISRTEEER